MYYVLSISIWSFFCSIIGAEALLLECKAILDIIFIYRKISYQVFYFRNRRWDLEVDGASWLESREGGEL